MKSKILTVLAALSAVGCASSAYALELTTNQRIEALEQSAIYQEQRIMNLDAALSKAEIKLARGTAMALAHASIPTIPGAEFAAGTGVGVIAGQAAVAAGFQAQIDAGKTFKASVSMTEGGETSAAIGFAARF